MSIVQPSPGILLEFKDDTYINTALRIFDTQLDIDTIQIGRFKNEGIKKFLNLLQELLQNRFYLCNPNCVTYTLNDVYLEIKINCGYDPVVSVGEICWIGIESGLLDSDICCENIVKQGKTLMIAKF